MKFIHSLAALAAAAALLAGCSSTRIQDYANTGPQLVPSEFFNGRLCADGVVKNVSGQVTRHFSARILASWDATGIGTLDETFQFNDRPMGDYEKRIWTLVPDGEGAYLARANDVPEAGRLEFAGNSVHMNYVLHYKTADGETVKLTMDDWMHLVSNRSLMNETRMSKFGFTVGHIVLSIRQAGPADLCLPGNIANPNIERISM